MKKAFMLLGLAALVLATSCEREDLNKVKNASQKTFEGDVAYIVVNINDVNDAGTRATSDSFEYGTTAEYAVNDAHFYFYSSDGEFVAESDVWDGGSASEDDPAINVEFKGKTVVTLHGLSGTTYPNWVVTVLNQPAGFTAPKTLAEFATALAENNDNGVGTPGEYGIYTKGAVEIIDDSGSGSNLSGDGKVYFTMCTSSFNPASGTEAAAAGYSSTYYFATPVVEANFALEDIVEDGAGGYKDANGESVPPITIYVERLVAKTRVVSGLNGGTQLSDGYTYYPITVQEEVGDVSQDVNLYVRLEGWELNGVSNNTYMAKRVDTSWSLGFDWNDAANYRSYWAMSTAYGDADSTIWPDSSNGSDYDNAKNMNPYLRWFDYSTEYIHSIGTDDCQYCGENTNTAQGTNSTLYVINSKRHAAITNALIFATIGEINDGAFTPSTLVRENGTLYTEEGYLNYAASHIYLYTKYVVGDSDTKYPDETPGTIIFTQLGPDYLELYTSTDGYIHVRLNQDALSAAQINTLYETTTADDTGVSLEAADAYIEEHFNAVYGYGANGYNEGMMYYSIPIEHLNNTEMSKDEETGVEIPYEGTYGMVRNHIYNLTITGIENIGWGVWDPTEVIIPQEDIETYSLTCQINILSWKLVNQSVTL